VSDPRELFDALTSLVAHRREAMRDNWHRDLPFQELLSDRWKRAAKLGFGEGASIYETSFVYGEVKVGRNTWIGPYTLLDGSGGLTIGDFCSISAGVQIYTHDTVKWAVTGGEAEYERAPVAIGDCCHIGANVVVAKSVTIGSHSVVGACAFVNRDIPDYSIAVGAPARIIGRVRVDGGSATFEYFNAKGDLP
jgi:acetyltransferase-like isoleucine patch superfamily enzyme